MTERGAGGPGEFVRSVLKIAKDPLHLSYITKGFRNETVADVLGCQLHLVWSVLQPDTVVRWPAGIPDDWSPQKEADLKVDIYGGVARAVPFLWSKDAFRDALAFTYERHALGAEALPFPLMLWVYPKPTPSHIVGSPIGSAPTVFIDAFLVGELWEGTLSNIAIGRTSEDPSSSHPFVALGYRYPYGRVYPDEGMTNDATPAQLLAAFAFLASPCAVVTSRGFDRAERRRLERAGSREEAARTVQFVDLRRVEQTRQETIASAVAWRYRWRVRGHERRQWYPSRASHELVWIASHEKGPAGRPFKPAVYRVSR